MNKVILMGRLTRNPDIRYSQGENSMAVARFTIAVDRRFKREGAQTVDFISCVAFGKTAEFFERYVKQGTKLCVEGRIQTGSYERNGQKVYTTDVVVENAEFAESKAASSSAQAPAPAAAAAPQAQPQQYQQPAPEAASEGFMSIPDGLEDEGLPFN